MNILKEIKLFKNCFILAIIIFTLLIVSMCKNLSDREIEQIIKKWVK